VEGARRRHKESKSLELLLSHWHASADGAAEGAAEGAPAGGKNLYKCHDGKVFLTQAHAESHVRKRYPAPDYAALAQLIAVISRTLTPKP